MMSDEISLFVFANHAAAFLVQYPAGALSDRYGRLAVIAAMTLAGAAVALAVALTELQDFWLLLAASVAVGGVAHSLHTAGAVHANDRLSPDLYVAGAATLLVAYDIGTSLGPLAASYAMARLGPPGLYWFIALLVGSVGALALANLAVRLPGGQRFTGGG
jgi:MFS family permease